jgi:hypothetical protein
MTMSNDIIRMARESGIKSGDSYKLTVGHMSIKTLERFAAIAQAAERNKLAAWMMAQGYATGHGETVEGLLEELEREVGFKRAELWIKRISEAVLAEREACAVLCDQLSDSSRDLRFGAAVRARGQA